MVVPVVTVVIVTTPSRLKAPRTVRRFHLTGASPHARSPIGARAERRVMFVKIPLSSRKTLAIRIDRRHFLAEVIPFGGNIRPPVLTRP
jgi:hypothetical protein